MIRRGIFVIAVIVMIAVVSLWAQGSLRAGLLIGHVTDLRGQCGRVEFKNQLGYPIWLGEQGPSVIAPIVKGNIDWEISSGRSVNLCLPKGYESANFWGRTECQFDTYYPTRCAKRVIAAPARTASAGDASRIAAAE